MSPPGTPSRVPARSHPSSQFASAPRFLLSQRVDRRTRDTQSPYPDGLTYSSPAPTARTAKREREITQALRQKEVIEDSDSELDQDGGPSLLPSAQTGVGDITSSPPEVTEIPDADFEDLFEPVINRAKRRRVSGNEGTPLRQRNRRPDRDLILSSSPESPSSTKIPTTDPPSPSLPYRTPNPPRHPWLAPQAITPRQPLTPATEKPSIRNNSRFLTPSSQLPPGSQQSKPIPRLTATPRPTSPPQKRKPTFVLPRSPSPSQTTDHSMIPTPFSPSSHALRRRGRARSATPSYLPGGMAAEVRSWILEMGTKQEQSYSGAGRPDVRSSPDMGRYTLVVCIDDVRQSALGSCGPLAFIQGRAIDSLDSGFDSPGSEEDDPKTGRNVLLLGPPRLRQGELQQRVPNLQRGHVVGVCRGLVWEVGVGADNQKIGGTMNSSGGVDYDSVLRDESRRIPGSGKWLVGMEWEVIASS